MGSEETQSADTVEVVGGGGGGGCRRTGGSGCWGGRVGAGGSAVKNPIYQSNRWSYGNSETVKGWWGL